jgi:rubrerythrin
MFRAISTLTFRVRARVAPRLHAFARAEEGSRRDLRLAAAATESAARAALYLRHANDEARHARALGRRADEIRKERGEPPLGAVEADVEALFAALGEVGFVAFVHRGERRGREQFEEHVAFFRARGDERTATMFEAILADERRHETYTGALLLELSGGDARTARRALRRVTLWSAWRAFRRVGRALVAPVYVLSMWLLYLASAPLALLTRVVRPTKTGWGPPETDPSELDERHG